MKKVLSLFLALSMIFTISIGSFASEKTSQMSVSGQIVKVKIIKENNLEKVVEVTSGNEKSISTFNKTTGEITKLETNGRVIDLTVKKKLLLEKTSKNSSNLYLQSIGPKETIDQLQSDDHGYAVKRSWDSQKAKYDYFWDLSIKNQRSFDYPQTSSNEGKLNSFRTKVRDIQLKKYQIASAFGAGTLATIIALLAATPETLGLTAVVALLVAGGAGIGAAYYGAELYFYQCDADYIYRTI